MRLITIHQLAKILNLSHSNTARKIQKLVAYGLAVQVTNPRRCDKIPTVFDLKIPFEELLNERTVQKIAENHGIVIEKEPKPKGMSDLSKFCANPFNLGVNHG